MFDTYGDGWNGSNYTISNSIQSITGTLESGWDGSSSPICIVTNPGLIITNPMDDSIITTKSVTVNFSVSNFIVGNNTGDGHIHYFVNGVQTMKYDILPIVLTNLVNNSYTIDLQLVNNAHQPLTPNVVNSITFIVSGCTDEDATNYNSNVDIDNGSCYIDIDLNIGWNLASICIQKYDIIDYYNSIGIVNNTLYYYNNNQYEKVDNLDINKGFWIKTNSNNAKLRLKTE